MIICIRFFFVSVSLFTSVYCNETLLNFPENQDVILESVLETSSEWSTNRVPFLTNEEQNLKGNLRFIGKYREGPLPFLWTFDDFSITTNEGNTTHTVSLKEPNYSMPMHELQKFLARPLAIEIDVAWPYLALQGDLLRTYGNLEVFKTPFFASLFGEEIALILNVASRALKVGEGFEISIPESNFHPFRETHIVHLKEKTARLVVVEVTKIIDRQRIIKKVENKEEKRKFESFVGEAIAEVIDEIKGGVKKESPSQVVVSGLSKGVFTINREAAFLFSYQESGTFNFVTHVDGVDLSLKQTHLKRVSTRERDE